MVQEVQEVCASAACQGRMFVSDKIRLSESHVNELREVIAAMPENDATQVAVTLARIEERVKSADEKMSEIAKKVDALQSEYEKKFVTQQEFDPVKRIVYGMVTAILVSVLGALLALVVAKGGTK